MALTQAQRSYWAYRAVRFAKAMNLKPQYGWRKYILFGLRKTNDDYVSLTEWMTTQMPSSQGDYVESVVRSVVSVLNTGKE